MKKISLKLAVGLLAFVVGTAIVWASDFFKVLSPTPAKTPPAATGAVPSQPPFGAKSGKVLIRFKEFERAKIWIADFEITNDTAQPILYLGREGRYKLDYCTLAVKHQREYEHLSFKVTDLCYYAKRMSLQTIAPGESIVLSVYEHEVREMLNLKDAKSDTKAHIGFEFFVGESKQREILWSEEITFPYDEHR